MPLAKLYPGAIDNESIRGLVLLSGGGVPELSLVPAGGPPVVESIVISSQVKEQLAIHGISAWRFRIAGLRPGVRYRLSVANGQGRVTEFQCLDQKASELKIVVASCYYGYLNKGWSYRDVLNGDYCRGAAFKLLVGDNLYLDVHPRQRDDSLDGGYLETVWLYLQYWFYQQDYAEVLGSGPTLTTWDDHEFWNNYPAEQLWLWRSKSSQRRDYEAAGRECVRLFQATLNPPGKLPPAPRAPGDRDNLSYEFDASPVSLFVADLRTERQDAGVAGARMMPEATLQAMVRWARTLQRPGVLVLGQPLLIAPGDWTDRNPPAYETEYAAIWDALDQACFDVLVLSGDVHHSRVLELTSPRGKPVYEIVSSPACHIPGVVWWKFGIDYERQDRGGVKFPLVAPVGAHRATVRHCWFATDVPNTIATVTFRRLANSEVEVGCTFLDLETRGVARAVPSPCGAPSTPECAARSLFKLRQRQEQPCP
ncbi:MAG: hypothetical protein MUC36_27045 [Planctomycetes bacterium]|jgi:hypothetical protein|nr:hypothetical protein [Planctomycetota bacterium]